jgi:hypothetical protein
MFYIPFTLMVIVAGMFLYVLTKILPILNMVFFDWFAIGLLVFPAIFMVYTLSSKRVLWFLEKIPKDKILVFFIRRNGDLVPVLGSRAYPGESFIDVPKLGLLHDIGNVQRFGVNNVQFALENLNHTADPTYANFNRWLYEIGFNNIAEVKATLSGEFKEKQDKVEPKISDKENVDVLVDSLKSLPDKELKDDAK